MEIFKKTLLHLGMCWVGLGLAVNNRETLNKSGLHKLAVYFFFMQK